MTRALPILSILLLLPACGEMPEVPAPKRAPWSQEIVDLASRIPLQDDGRLKPLSTWSRFALLSMNGRSSVKFSDDLTLDSTEWILDCLFYPEEAKNYPTFLLQTSSALDALRLTHDDKKKRDRYSYNELRLEEPVPGRGMLRGALLGSLADRYEKIEARKRTAEEMQIVELDRNVALFGWLVKYLDFARHDFGGRRLPLLDVPPDEAPPVRLSTSLARYEAFLRFRMGINQLEDPDLKAKGISAWQALWQDIRTAVDKSRVLAILPPRATRQAQPDWMTPYEIHILVTDRGSTDYVEQIALLGLLEDLALAPDDREAFTRHLGAFQTAVKGLAESRGEYVTIDLEVAYYNMGLLHWSLGLFVIAFALLAASWLRPAGVWLNRSAAGALLVAVISLTIAIVIRCIIRSRPPVSTLYETILFITAAVVVAALVIEWFNRQRIAIALAAILGTGGVFLAQRYEASQGVDTMPTLIAVLDTNFWLSTHVTAITLGYAAGLLAAAIGAVFILGKAFGIKRGDAGFYRTVTRMTYGVICFTLLFSIVGTNLGGIWANDSWGRFWGWDPKENGALMICLWGIAVLHSRMGGYIRDLGLAMAAVFGGMIVAFSWWHVNHLGIGLHSYGFTSGVIRNLWFFYGSQLAILGIGGGLWYMGSFEKATRPARGKEARAREKELAEAKAEVKAEA